MCGRFCRGRHVMAIYPCFYCVRIVKVKNIYVSNLNTHIVHILLLVNCDRRRYGKAVNIHLARMRLEYLNIIRLRRVFFGQKGQKLLYGIIKKTQSTDIDTMPGVLKKKCI